MNKINYTFDSDEERYFYDWLIELCNLGYVDWIYSERKTFKLIRDKKVLRLNKKKYQEFVLTKKREYTPDFIFKFNPKAKYLFYHDKIDGYNQRPFFYCHNNRGIIYLDIKGGFNGNKSDNIFPDRQSMMMDKFEIYVQKVIPFSLGTAGIKKQTLFKETFTPQTMINDQVYASDRVGKWRKGDSKLKYKVTKIHDYVNNKTMD